MAKTLKVYLAEKRHNRSDHVLFLKKKSVMAAHVVVPSCRGATRGPDLLDDITFSWCVSLNKSVVLISSPQNS